VPTFGRRTTNARPGDGGAYIARTTGIAREGMDDDPHALQPTLIRLVVMAAAFFEDVPDDVLDPHDALKYLEAISGEIDQITPRDRSLFALLMHDEAKRQPDRKEFILSLIPSDASWADGD
jgi:hypothetical protein